MSQTNLASKALQSIKTNVQTAVIALESVIIFLGEYKEYGCEKVFAEAEGICDQISIEPIFDCQKRPAARSTIANEEEFQSKVFLPIIESAICSITERFAALQKYNQLFSFLYDFENYETNRESGALLESCKKLQNALMHNGESDIDADDLFAELTLVSTLTLNENIVHVIDILNAIQNRGMENLVPNVVIAFRILLTIPVSVASGERSFSKLKLIKTYLRNSMNPARLSDLTIISIENEVANSISYDDITEEFAAAKARKGKF